MAEYEMEPFGEVMMLGEWPVVLPAYRVAHCAAQANWEEGRLRSMHAHLGPGHVLYDVGAEHADLTNCYNSWLGDDGGVVVIEASEKFWPVIKATFEANGTLPIACWAGFASDRDAPESERTPSWSTPSFTIPQPDGSGWPSWADAPAVPHHGFRSVIESGRTLPNVRIDTLATMTRPPDAMSIDVEGAELLVLRGAERVLRELRPVVFVSIHPTLIAHDYPESGVMGTGDPDHERQRILDYMASLGYAHHHIETNHEEHHCFWAEELTDFDPRAGIEYLVG